MGTETILLEEQKELRHRLRARRCALSDDARDEAARAVCSHLTAAEVFKQARALSAYLAINGELELRPIIEQAWAADKHVCLPVVTGGRGTVLEFRPFASDTRLTANRYGIEEPESDASGCPVEQLDLVLCPIVAFDDLGTRVGMGGGYYDATFQSKLDNKSARPTLLGVAYDIQRVGSYLERNEWDVPLDGVVTETGIRWFGDQENAWTTG
ncbi:MAG: 5-formyltetrahydrofolate cyclo-ligase [Gammaproteobacteria bacterium]|nr:MAG: 5-formyltetrahydrofolate cyclo-ligase [Gammaproteobacteria bacterium]